MSLARNQQVSAVFITCTPCSFGLGSASTVAGCSCDARYGTTGTIAALGCKHSRSLYDLLPKLAAHQNLSLLLLPSECTQHGASSVGFARENRRPRDVTSTIDCRRCHNMFMLHFCKPGQQTQPMVAPGTAHGCKSVEIGGAAHLEQHACGCMPSFKACFEFKW